MDRTGQCLCGAVRFTAKGMQSEAAACHCGMCLRWSGGPFIGVMTESLAWQAAEALQVIASSAWAERGFCNRCGSSLYYRLTAPGKYHGATSIALGALDDTRGITLTKEWFVDRKPDAYALAGEHRLFTEADALAMLGD
jgi:hypothetical protein